MLGEGSEQLPLLRIAGARPLGRFQVYGRLELQIVFQATSDVQAVALLPQFKGVQAPSWIVGLAFGTPLLYFLGLWSHHAMTHLDRVIMLLELVIANPPPDEASSIC